MPRHIGIAAVALGVAVVLAELLAAAIGAGVPSVAKLSPRGTVEAVVLVSPLLLIFYAGPLLGFLRTHRPSAWPVAALLGLLPGVALGAASGLIAYGVLVGLLAGLASVALLRLVGRRGVPHRREGE